MAGLQDSWLTANWPWVVTVLMAVLFVVSAIGNKAERSDSDA